MKQIILAGLMLLSSVAIANATTIDFNSNADNNYWVSPVTSNGFMFSDLTPGGIPGVSYLGTASSLGSNGTSVTNGTVHLYGLEQ